MFLQASGWSLLGGTALSLLLSSCAIQNYPGQPGVRTNGFAKIDMETLDEAGLWVYEVSYDNSENGGGVEQVVTKLYPGALTNTSNVRTNAEGSLYRHKYAYQGASIQMISFPKTNTVLIPEGSQVMLTVDYETSLDEIDDRNLNEESLFSLSKPSAKFFAQARLRWQLLKAGEFSDGKLFYTITKVKLDLEELNLSGDPIRLSTNLNQTGIILSINAAQKIKLRDFINTKFPKGYKGMVELNLADGSTFELPLAVHTLDSLKASGKSVLVQDLNNQQTSAQ